MVSEADANVRMNQRASFDVGFALIYLSILHGFSILKILLILYINFKAATQLPRRLIPYVTWSLNISILFTNELCQGYRFAQIAEFFSPVGVENLTQLNWGEWLDKNGGLMSRWEILFNLTILRLISFNLDYYWSLSPRNENMHEVVTRSKKIIYLS